MSFLKNIAWVLFSGMAVSSTFADMTIAGYSSARHDRFYVGSDRTFLGETMDWSGVGRSINTTTSNWATMISPSFFVSANHFHANVGDTVRFYYSNDPNGGYEERTVIDGSHIGSSDVWIGRLASSVSSHVTQYALADNSSLPIGNVDPLIGQKIWQFGLNSTFKYSPWCRQAIGRNIITASDSSGIDHPYNYENQYGTLGQDEANAVLGDSGSPAFVTANGHPILAGERYLPSYSGSVGYLTNQIQSYINFATGGKETIVTAAIPDHTSIPVIRETFQNDNANSTPKGGDQTIQLIKTGSIMIAGQGGTYLDPFGGTDNKSIRMQASSINRASSMFFEGLQTGVVQGQCLIDIWAKNPNTASTNAMFNLLIGHDYYGDSILNTDGAPCNESVLDVALQRDGHLNIQTDSGNIISDQVLEFDKTHKIQVFWRSQGVSDAYGDILVDGQRITANNGQIRRFLLKNIGNSSNDVDRIDSAYLTANWNSSDGDSEVYFDNLYLLDIPEPTSLGLCLLVSVMIGRRQRLC